MRRRPRPTRGYRAKRKKKLPCENHVKEEERGKTRGTRERREILSEL
jgi:hypothetical protein